MTEVKPEFIFICLMLLHGNFAAALNCSSPTPVGLFEALGSLFNNKQIRPVQNLSGLLNVTISFTVADILGLDEKAEVLSVIIWRVLEWDIQGLNWDVENCGTDRVSVPEANLWIPDIQITEMVNEDKSTKTPYVYLFYTGHVYNDQPLRVDSYCQLMIYTFPFDIQNCSLSFGSYLHFDTDIMMLIGKTAEEIFQESRSILQTDGEWELADITAVTSTVSLNSGNYSEVQYFLILRRRPLFYVVNLLVPSCLLITVDLLSFLLPTQSVDRSSFKMTLILGYTVFLLVVNELLPITGGATPLINVFFSISLALMVVSLLETLFITNLQCNPSMYYAVPHWLSVLVLQYLAVLVCLPQKKKNNLVSVFLIDSNEDSTLNSGMTNMSAGELHSVPNDTAAVKSTDPALEELKNLRKDLMAIRFQVDKHYDQKNSQEWEIIGMVMDRLLFGLYIVFITVSFITIMSIWLWNDSYKRE